MVAGYAFVGGTQDTIRAFRWTQASGMANLGLLNGGSMSFAAGVSSDGSVVVRYATDGGAASNVPRAMRWTPQGRMQTIEQWLLAAGVAVAQDFRTHTAYGWEPRQHPCFYRACEIARLWGHR